MREIERQLIEAIEANKPFHKGNTMYDAESRRVYLHGNHIATLSEVWRKGPELNYSFAGWRTQTTTSRINAIIDWWASKTGTKPYRVRRSDPAVVLNPHKWFVAGEV